MNWQMWGVIGGFLALFFTIIGQTWVAAYWAGVFTTNLKNLDNSVKNLQSRDELFVKEKDYLLQVANRNKEVSDMWKAQNDLRNKFEDCRASSKECHAG